MATQRQRHVGARPRHTRCNIQDWCDVDGMDRAAGSSVGAAASLQPRGWLNDRDLAAEFTNNRRGYPNRQMLDKK